jgi:hypothetical protein
MEMLGAPNSLRLLVRLRTAVLAFAAIAATLTAAPAQAGSDVAHAPAAKGASHGPSYMTGIGDEQPEMFNNPLWRQLHTQIVRYIAPYDAVSHPYSLDKAKVWIHDAEAQHQQVMVAFYHSEYTPTRMPSVALYKRDVGKFVKLFPHVRVYQSWDESNRGNVPHAFSSPSASAAARYYQALKRDCTPCTVIGLDILDADSIGPTLNYIAEFKREIYRLHTLMPSIWGLHDYSDVNRFESWRTRTLDRALGSQVWLTETGGVVKFGGAFPNNHGSGLRRAAKVISYVFKVAASEPRIKRVYFYNWTGGTSRTRFDAGLMNVHYQPREGYTVLCRQLHAPRCGVRIAKN